MKVKRIDAMCNMNENEVANMFENKHVEIVRSLGHEYDNVKFWSIFLNWLTEEVEPYTEEQREALKWLLDGGYKWIRRNGMSSVIARYSKQEKIYITKFTAPHVIADKLKDLRLSSNLYVSLEDLYAVNKEEV